MADYQSKYTGEQIDEAVGQVENKLDKVNNTSSTNQVYSTVNGTQNMTSVSTNGNPNWLVAYGYDTQGNDKPGGTGKIISQEPTKPYQVANMKFVLDNKGTKLFRHSIDFGGGLGITLLMANESAIVQNGAIVFPVSRNESLVGGVINYGNYERILYVMQDKMVIVNESGTITTKMYSSIAGYVENGFVENITSI